MVIGVLVVALLGVAWALSNQASLAPRPGATSGPPGESVSPAATPGGTGSPSSPTPAQSQPANTATSAPPQSGASGELPPVGMRSESQRSSGVVVTVERIEAVPGEARLPGEVAAPAVRFTILIRNGSPAAIALGSVVVNAYAGEDRAPLETISSPGGSPFEGSLAPGAEATGVYLFTVAPDRRSDITLTVDPKAGEPASTFRGAAQG